MYLITGLGIEHYSWINWFPRSQIVLNIYKIIYAVHLKIANLRR